jgi:hypothetical protein
MKSSIEHAGWNIHNKTDAPVKTVGLHILRPYQPVVIGMPGNGKSGEFESESQSNIDWDSVKCRGGENDPSFDITAWRSRNTEWKDCYDEILPPGNYTIHTHDTETDTAHTTVASLFDGLSDYYIWDTRDVSSSAKTQRRGDPPHKHVLVRTEQAIPVDQLPDRPRITSY